MIVVVSLLNLLECATGIEIQPQLNKQHKDDLLNGDESSELLGKIGEGDADEGHPEDDVEENDNELDDVKYSEVIPSVVDELWLLAPDSKDSNEDIGEGNYEQGQRDVVIDSREHSEDEDSHQQVTVYNRKLVQKGSCSLGKRSVFVIANG